MTAVSQLLPNFIQGINEQPDELKKPGQVRDAVNVYPDVTKGLCKRTGYEKVTDVTTTTTGTWFYVTRREGTLQKKYIFHVSTSGFVSGWDADTGTSQTILRSELPVNLGLGSEEFSGISTLTMSDIEYLSSDSNYGIKTATLADTTFLCNTDQVTSMSSSEEGIRPYESFIEFKAVDVTRAYQINFDRIGNSSNTTSQVVDYKEVDKFKFKSGGKSEEFSSCPAAGTHNLTSNGATNSEYASDPHDNGRITGEIQLRVTIGSQPKILQNSEKYSCEYYISNSVLLSGGEGWKVGDTFRVNLPNTYGDKNVTMGIKYEVTEVLTTTGPVDVPNISVTPAANNNSVQNLQNLLADEIISRVSAFDSNFGENNIEIIGNGIYISDSLPFKIDTTEGDLLNILTNQAENVDDSYPNPVAVVNNVSKLPLECKQGFTVKVQNSFTEDDDYFVQFVRDYGDAISTRPTLSPTVDIVDTKVYTITTTDGTFDWSTVGPGLTSTSPVGTEFRANANGTATGSNSVTELPRYVESGMGYWKEIAKPGERSTMDSGSFPHVLRYRANTEDWVVASVSYAKRTCGTEDQFTPSFVQQKINNILFYRNRLVFISDSSVVTSNAGDFTNFFPSTALVVSPSDPVDVEATSNYTANLYSGIQINNALLIFGEYNQFLLTTDSDIFSPNTAKLSQVSSYKFDTKSDPFIIGTNIGFIGNTKDSSSMYEMTNIFREGQTDVVEKSKPISNSFANDYCMTSSSKETGLITFGKKGSDTIWLYKYFKENSQSDLQQAWFKWKLSSNVNYQFIDGNKHYVVTDGGELLCNDLESDVYQDNGVDYEMKLVLPTFYVLKNEQSSFKADTTSSLIIHRMYLNTGESNFYTINIDRFGKDPYIVNYEQSIQDEYEAGSEPVTVEREQSIPLYERNTSLDVSITSTFNGPFTLYSLRWEGDYNNRYYQRV